MSKEALRDLAQRYGWIVIGAAAVCWVLPLMQMSHNVILRNLPTTFRPLNSSMYMYSLTLGLFLVGLSVPIVRLLLGKTSKPAYFLAIAGVMGSFLWMDLPSLIALGHIPNNWGTYVNYVYRPWLAAIAVWIVSVCLEAGYERKWHLLISVLGIAISLPIFMMALGDFVAIYSAYPFFVGLPPLWLLAVSGWAYLASQHIESGATPSPVISSE